MPASLPFVQVDPKDYRILGRPDPETRIYRREGSRDEIAEWCDKVFDVAGHVVSPGGAIGYADVSRAGIYKAINEGRLTAFGFHVTSVSRGVFGFKRKARESPYILVPVSECKAWGKIIAEKLKAKTLTLEDNPGWVDESKFRKIEAGPMQGKYPKRKTKK
jgi:hypothetical protein